MNTNEVGRLVELTETFFNIANKAGNLSKEEKLFMNAMGVGLAGYGTDKYTFAKGFLGTQEVSRQLQDKLADKDAPVGDVLAGLLGNYNYDKKVDDADAHTINGKQMAAMYATGKTQLILRETREKKTAEELMVGNMVDILLYHIDSIKDGAGKLDWKSILYSSSPAVKSKYDALLANEKDTTKRATAIKEMIAADLREQKTERQLLERIAAVPTILMVYQDIFRLAGDNASILFLKGAAGYKEVIERKADQYIAEQKVIPEVDWARPFEQITKETPVETEAATILSPEQIKGIEAHVHADYERNVTELWDKAIKEGKYADGTNIPEQLRPDVEKALQKMLEEDIKQENVKQLKINALGLFLNTIKGERGIGAGANITSDKINDALSHPETGWYNTFNVTPGIYMAPNGKPIIGVMAGLHGGKTTTNEGGDHTFMYGVAVGAGLANGKMVVGPSAVV